MLSVHLEKIYFDYFSGVPTCNICVRFRQMLKRGWNTYRATRQPSVGCCVSFRPNRTRVTPSTEKTWTASSSTTATELWTPVGARSALRKSLAARWQRCKSSRASAGNSKKKQFLLLEFLNICGNVFIYRFGGSGTVVVPFTSMLLRNSTFTLRLFFLLESPELVHTFADGLLFLDDGSQYSEYPIGYLWRTRPRLKDVVISSATRWLWLYLQYLNRPIGVAAGG